MRRCCVRLIPVLLVAMVLVPEAPAQVIGPGGWIPVVANNVGLAGTFWRSDVSITNFGETDTQVVLRLFPEIVGGTAAFELVQTDPIDLDAGEQLTLSNVVQTQFGMVNAKGALHVYSTDGTPLVLASRTYTSDPDDGGTYGQNVNGVMVIGRAWAAGLRNDGLFRTNIGIFWPGFGSAQFTITVYDSSGQEMASDTVSFNEFGLQQRTFDSLGVALLVDGYVEVTCSDSFSGWYAYASRVDQISGDAVYRPLLGQQS